MTQPLYCAEMQPPLKRTLLSSQTGSEIGPMRIRKKALRLAKSNALFKRLLLALFGPTSCVITRAQDSELPFFDAFVRHHVDRLGFDKIFVIFCDRREPTLFTEEMRQRHGSKVEVLY